MLLYKINVKSSNRFDLRMENRSIFFVQPFLLKQIGFSHGLSTLRSRNQACDRYKFDTVSDVVNVDLDRATRFKVLEERSTQNRDDDKTRVMFSSFAN